MSKKKSGTNLRYHLRGRPDPVRGPYDPRRWKFSRWFVIWFAFMVGFLFGMRFHAWMLERNPAAEAGWENSWMPKERMEEIARYHGPYHRYKLTEDRLLLFRDGKWITVERRF